MQFKQYSSQEILMTAGSQFVETIQYTRGSFAANVLPSDTAFALVAELLERAESESFWEVSTGLGQTSISADSSIQGRAIGFIALTQSTLRVFKNTELYSEAPLQAVRIDKDNAQFVLHMNNRKFKLIQVYPIADPAGYESKTGVLNDGLDPFLDHFPSQVVLASRASIRGAAIFWIIFLALLIGISIFLITASN